MWVVYHQVHRYRPPWVEGWKGQVSRPSPSWSSGFPEASVSVAVTLNEVPAVCDPMDATTSLEADAAETDTEALVDAVNGEPA